MLRRRTDRERDLALAEAGIPIWSPGPKGPPRIYKARDHKGPKKAPKCVACFPRSSAGQRVPLPYGVTLTLCREHRDPRFIASQSGRRFLAGVGEVCAGLGITARRYGEALRAFVDQCTNPRPAPRHRPGSYAWPDQRQAAELVWARGGTFEAGLAAALGLPPPPGFAFRLPSVRTVRRWWQERRWLTPPADRRGVALVAAA